MDEELCIGCIVDDVDVLVAQLAHDTVHTATFNTNACAYRVDAFVEAFNCYLSTLARHTGNAANGNKTLGYFWHFCLEQTL